MAVLAEFDLWMFLAGLGIFLFGMHMMEESIKVLSGAAFKSMIRRYTGTRMKAMASGMFSTAVLQSSSAVSLMTLAFVGAGIMNLIQAVSVMIGAKVGTTATAWIVAVFGFEMDIEAFSLPLIGIGGLGIILLARSSKYVNISKFLVAFGFLFMGLDFMKSSVDEFAAAIDPGLFAGYGILVFALAGLVLTAIMQSSSATIAIVLTMLFSGVIDFEAGAAMVVGANVGTTVTVLLGAIGGIHTKKQAAVSQLVFTTGTAIITLLLLPLLTWLVLDAFGFSSNLVLGLALFHTLFNAAGAALFYPIIPSLAIGVERWIPERHVQLSRYIHKTTPEVTDAGLEAFRKEVVCQLRVSMQFIRQLLRQGRSPGEISYADLENYHADIFEYYTRLHGYELSEEEVGRLDELLRVSRNIMNSSRNIFETVDEFAAIEREVHEVHRQAWQSVRERLERVTDFALRMRAEPERGQGELKDELKELQLWIESSDKSYIRMCGKGVADPTFHKAEVTLLLMVNRMVTQTCRMLLYGIKVLLESEPLSESDGGKPSEEL